MTEAMFQSGCHALREAITPGPGCTGRPRRRTIRLPVLPGDDVSEGKGVMKDPKEGITWLRVWRTTAMRWQEKCWPRQVRTGTDGPSLYRILVSPCDHGHQIFQVSRLFLCFPLTRSRGSMAVVPYEDGLILLCAYASFLTLSHGRIMPHPLYIRLITFTMNERE